MKLLDLIRRTIPPAPWSDGDNIPWHDSAFSNRMLREHLSQAHDAASRRLDKIEKHVQWINDKLLSGCSGKILDLACGPGLYTTRLAKLGHECVGIDYSPASISHAVELAKQANLSCKYLEQDIREADYGMGFSLVMLNYGELNIFALGDSQRILTKACAALRDDGLILLEPHTFSAVEKIGNQDRSWYSAEAGLSSDQPHLCLEEHFWDAIGQTATTRYFIVDVSTGDMTPHAVSYQAYSEEQYHSLLVESGFAQMELRPSLSGNKSESQEGLIAIVAQKRGEA